MVFDLICLFGRDCNINIEEDEMEKEGAKGDGAKFSALKNFWGNIDNSPGTTNPKPKPAPPAPKPKNPPQQQPPQQQVRPPQAQLAQHDQASLVESKRQTHYQDQIKEQEPPESQKPPAATQVADALENSRTGVAEDFKDLPELESQVICPPYPLTVAINELANKIENAPTTKLSIEKTFMVSDFTFWETQPDLLLASEEEDNSFQENAKQEEGEAARSTTAARGYYDDQGTR